ncbi:30S ribosomal protein S2, partial [Clarias magur]
MNPHAGLGRFLSPRVRRGTCDVSPVHTCSSYLQSFPTHLQEEARALDSSLRVSKAVQRRQDETQHSGGSNRGR